MPGQVQRQLNARRKFCELFVDADLEEERAVLMPQDDSGGNRRIARAQRYDLALVRCRERGGCAANKTGIAIVLRQRGAARAFPAAGFQRQEGLERGRDVLGRTRDLET